MDRKEWEDEIRGQERGEIGRRGWEGDRQERAGERMNGERNEMGG